jgi:hypothetical protein
MRISIEGVVSQLMNQGFKIRGGAAPRSGSDSEMQRFESSPLQRVTYEGRSKTARYREVSQI